MSLNSETLASEFRRDVYVPEESKSKIPLAALLGITISSGVIGDMLSSFESRILTGEQAKFLADNVSISQRCAMFLHAVKGQLSCDLSDIYAYIISSKQSADFSRHVDFSVTDDNFIVLGDRDSICFIVARESDVSLHDFESDFESIDASDCMHRILSSGEGYHFCTSARFEPHTFEEMLDYETTVQHNTAIYAYLSSRYKDIELLGIPQLEGMPSVMCKYFNSKILAILSSAYDCDFGKRMCVWICDTKASLEVVKDVYKDSLATSDEICHIRFEDGIIPLCDLGARGCLISAEVITVRKLGGSTSTVSLLRDNADASVDRNRYIIYGVPLHDDKYHLAVDEASFVYYEHRHPVASERAKGYSDLYLTQHIPNLPIWNQCPLSDHLYKIEMDSYGVKSITSTDTYVNKS